MLLCPLLLSLFVLSSENAEHLEYLQHKFSFGFFNFILVKIIYYHKGWF